MSFGTWVKKSGGFQHIREWRRVFGWIYSSRLWICYVKVWNTVELKATSGLCCVSILWHTKLKILYVFRFYFASLYKVHELHKQGGVISCHVNKHVSLISASTHIFEPYQNQILIAVQTVTQFIARIKTPLHAFDCNPKTESKVFFFFFMS